MSKRVSIFLAEDNPADAFLIQEALSASQLDYVLERAADGESALHCLESAADTNSCPSLILLDLNLPKISGHELLEFIRHSEVLRQAPVIILTSSDSASDRERAAALKIDHYFRKPSTFDEFLNLGMIVEKVCITGGAALLENAAGSAGPAVV